MFGLSPIELIIVGTVLVSVLIAVVFFAVRK